MTPEPFVSARSIGRVAIVLIVAGQVVQFSLGVLGVMYRPIHFLVFIPGAFGFLTWLQRAYRNLPALGATELRYTPGWAVVGSWFIPVVNLVAPYQVMSELWKASAPGTSDAATRAQLRSSPLLIGWWSSFVAALVLQKSTEYDLGLVLLLFSVVTSTILVVRIVLAVDRQQAEKNIGLVMRAVAPPSLMVSAEPESVLSLRASVGGTSESGRYARTGPLCCLRA